MSPSDDENQTAYLKLPNEGYWWCWYGSEIETDAFYLKLLARTDPKGELAPRLVKYVLNNRKHGTYWNSTRDTAFCIEALADYLKASGEDRPEMTVAIALDGQTRKEVKITPADLFTFDNVFAIEGKALAAGSHTVSFLKTGQGPALLQRLHDQLHARRPDHPRRSGNQGRSQGLPPYQGRQDGGNGRRAWPVGRPARRALSSRAVGRGATLKSGELVEVELEIDSKNDYEYLIFEDFKAAGFEPVEVRSGYNGNDLGAYVEFRDERVAFFARTLARGKHSVSYRSAPRSPAASTPCQPGCKRCTRPSSRANSDEIQLRIED